MNKKLKVLCAFAVPFLALGVGQSQAADNFPSKNITFVHPSSAGGGNDTYARGLAEVWQKYLPGNVNVVVAPKPGGGNRLGANYIYRAKPDGYTVGLFAIPGLVAAQMASDTSFDLREVKWLGSADVGARLVAISADKGINSVEELQAYDEELLVATSGITGSSGVTTIIAFDALGVKNWRPLNLPGTSEAKTAVLRGDADVLNFNVTSLLPLVKDGEIVPLFVTGTKERIPELPDVPTLTELGHPVGSYLADIRAIGTTPGVPDDVAKAVYGTLNQALADPQYHEWGASVNRTTNVLNGQETEEAMATLFDVFSKKKDILRAHIAR